MREITKSQFKKEVLNRQGKVVVDVYADWCSPCKLLKPVLDKLSSSYDGIDFFQLDGESESDIVSEYKVSSLPTILIFKDGELVKKLIGLQNEKALKEHIDAA